MGYIVTAFVFALIGFFAASACRSSNQGPPDDPYSYC